MDTAVISDLLSALAMLSGQAPLMWAVNLLGSGLATVDPWLDSPGLVQAHATLTEALCSWVVIVGSATAASVWTLPRLLGDR
jgi:hypothetical protein